MDDNYMKNTGRLIAIFLTAVGIFFISGIFYNIYQDDQKTNQQNAENRKLMTELQKVKIDYDAFAAYDDCKDKFRDHPEDAINHPSRVEIISQPTVSVPYFTHNKNGTYSTKTNLMIKDKLTDMKYNVYCWNTVTFDKQTDTIDSSKTKVEFTGLDESDDL